MDDALKKVRESAVGVELDEELAAQFPIRETKTLELPGEAEPIKLIFYIPENFRPGAPAILNLHGGGFVKGYRGRDVVFGRNVAFHTGCLYVDLDYRTAPEYRYPYALGECRAAARYLTEHADEWQIDPNRLVMMGESAGANLVAAANMIARDTGEFACSRMILCYPPLDLVTQPDQKPGINSPEEAAYAMRGAKYNEWYADEAQRKESHCSPVFAKPEELCGLPETLILTGGADPLAWEAEDFGLMLSRAGVTVTTRRLPDSEHGFLVRRTGGWQEAEKLIFRAVRQLREEKE